MKIARINTDLQREISYVLAEAENKDFHFITVTAVSVTNDLSVAKVYVTILEDDKKEEIMTALLNAKGFVRSQLFDRVDLRKIPDIRFIYDESVARGMRIEKIIEEVK